MKVLQKPNPPQRKNLFKTTCDPFRKICKFMVDSNSTKNVVSIDMVDFEMGEYKDKLLCDVILMNACHLVLGCPWQYDVDATHNYGKNTYTIVNDGVT